MSIVQTSDFGSGHYAIPQDKFTQLNSYITKVERKYLLQLLGAELYDLFIADLTLTTPQVPQSQIYLDFFNEFHIEIDGCNLTSEGIKEMLKAFIYFHWMRDATYRKTTFGVTTASAENATNNIYQGFNLVESYNQGVDIANTIQWYIQDNEPNYPLYNGDLFEYSSGI